MNNKKRILILSCLGILIILVITLGIARAFMNPIMPSDSVTEVSLSSCAKITLLDSGSSINLTNTAPMSDNRGLNTTPYEFSIKSSCEESIKYKVYLGVLSNSTLDASKIKYAIKEKESGDIVATGTLEVIGNNDFTNDEVNQIKTGVGTTSNIYTIMENVVVHESITDYQLYLWVSSETGNEVMDKTFTAGVIVKGYESVELFAEHIKSLYTTQGENGLYLHDETLENGANDGSLRYSGGDYAVAPQYRNIYDNIVNLSENDTGLLKFYCSKGESSSYVGKNCGSKYDKYYYLAYDENQTKYSTIDEARNQAIVDGYLVDNQIKNFICFGSDEEVCSNDDLYRIIGVFGEQVKIIKVNYATTDQLGINGAYDTAGSTEAIAKYIYKNASNTNDWSTSLINTINLNDNYVNNIGLKWSGKIAVRNWYVGKSMYDQSPKNIYNEEISEKVENKIGVVSASEFLFGAPSDWWRYIGYSFGGTEEDYDNSGYYNWLFSPGMLITANNKYDGVVLITMARGLLGSGSGSSPVKPTFFLKSNIRYVSGDGTYSNPYRIS